MVSIADFVFQLSQPAFFYSIVSLLAAFFFIKIYLKLNPSISRYRRSLMWLVPLVLPVCVLLVFQPQIMMAVVQTISIKVSGYEILAVSPSVLSVTGLICLSGAITAVVFLGLVLCFGSRFAHKRFHIVLMAPDEYVDVQQKVKTTARSLDLKAPKVGLVDDLVPNAFTVGHGRGATLVFSLGLLNMLNLDELSAVIAHELVHIKEKDFLFKSTVNALSVLSFFNPFAYLAASHAQKERELHADAKAAVLLDEPGVLAGVLAKIESVVAQFPKPRFVDVVSSNLFLVSPLVPAPRLLLASHPKITQRIQNINFLKNGSSKKHRRLVSTILLVCVLVCGVGAGVYAAMQVQDLAYQNGCVMMMAENQKYYLYNDALGRFNPGAPTGILFLDEANALRFLSYLALDDVYVAGYEYFDGAWYTACYLSCCVGANGETVIGGGGSPSLVVYSDRVVVAGQSGCPFSPFDSLRLKPDIVVYDQQHFRMSNMS